MSKLLALVVVGGLVTIGAAVGSFQSDPSGTPPLSNPQGLEMGLAPVAKRDLSRARALIRKVKAVPVGASKSYDRSTFGRPWTDDTSDALGHNGCSTRDDVLRRDMTGETLRDGRCVVLTGQLDDPYTGRKIAFSKSHPQAVQIDHVVALHYAWEHGADRWTDERREEYANDPLVLLAVDGPANIRKSDHGPSEWEPPNKTIWCALAVRQAQVEIKYRITVTTIDRHTMIDVCS